MARPKRIATVQGVQDVITDETDKEKIQSIVSELMLEELVSLRTDLEERIKQKQKEQKKDIYSKMLTMAKAAGFDSVEAFMASQKGRNPRSDKGVRLPPRYMNPDNPKNTWSGKGRKPGWVIEHLEDGGDLEELAID